MYNATEAATKKMCPANPGTSKKHKSQQGIYKKHDKKRNENLLVVRRTKQSLIQHLQLEKGREQRL